VDFFTNRIAASTDLQVTRLQVHHINDEGLGLKPDVYHTARAEKDARAAEMSAVKRLIGRDSVVIADGMNYIKGFRYQLYCESKALHTPSCVVRDTGNRTPRPTKDVNSDGLEVGSCRNAGRQMP
jgi:protein KTI12